MAEQGEPLGRVREATTVVRQRTRPSVVWIVPIVAALIGAWVAVTTILSEGPQVTIEFRSAEGLEAGKTKLRYNGVDVGTLMTVRLSDDHQRVIGTAQMAPKSEGFLVEGTKFWVVRPRISGATVSGLGTLISGAYIGMEIGSARGKKQRDFVALAAPPVVAGDAPGRFFVLTTPYLGSVDFGTPIYFRRLQVGEVASYELDADGKLFTVKAFVNAPYDRYVTNETHFFESSGVDVSLNASGLNVQTASFLAMLIGGITFETPPAALALPPAEVDTVFTLFKNRTEAFKPAARDPHIYVLIFRQTVRGLTRGAPVEFRGIPVGEVVDIQPQIDAKTEEFSVPVTVRVDARMLGVRILDEAAGEGARKQMVDAMVARGLRAQLRTGSLLTGALYVALDFFPDAPPATIDWSQEPAVMATVPGELEGIEARIADVIKKLDQVPFEAIGKDVRRTFAQLDQTLASARGALDNAGNLVEPDSALSEQLGATLQEVSRAARGLRVLADYLEQHPEALLRGKQEGTK